MLTEELSKLRGAGGSFSVTWALPTRRWRLRVENPWIMLPPQASLSRPVQTQGDSLPSWRLFDYLADALTVMRNVASDLPMHVRITSTTETGAYEMDPWDAKNERRIRLIEKKYAQGLTDSETAELARLKREIHDHMQTVDPRTADTSAEERIERLRKRLEAKKGKKA